MAEDKRKKEIEQFRKNLEFHQDENSRNPSCKEINRYNLILRMQNA